MTHCKSRAGKGKKEPGNLTLQLKEKLKNNEDIFKKNHLKEGPIANILRN